MTRGNGELPLAGIRVLELGRVLAGPFAALLLEDLGAEIVKVENTGTGDSTRATAPFVNGQSHYFICVNRGKRGISIDTYTAEGAALIRSLVRESDVVLHNFRPRVARKAGADHATLEELRPGVISCAITGFGATSSKAEEPAYDLVLEAMTGMLDVTGVFGQEPVKAGVPVADLFTGLNAALGILAALVRRFTTGTGAYLDIGMFDVTMALLAPLAARTLRTGDACSMQAARSPHMAPHGVYATTDGLIAIACPTQDSWLALCDALGRSDLAMDARYSTNADRLTNADALDSEVGAVLAGASNGHWTAALEGRNVAWAVVADVGSALESEQVRANGVRTDVDYPGGTRLEVVASPFAFSVDGGAPVRNRPRPAPALGGDTVAVLTEILALPDEAIDDLVSRGIVRTTTSAAGAR